MNRCILAIMAIVLAASGLISPAFANAQTMATPVEDMVLGIAEGDGWSYALDAENQPVQDTVAMMIDGVPQLEFAPAVLEMYQQHEMRDAYAWSVNMLPANYEPISTTIEIRVLTFSTDENASAFLGEFYDQLVGLTPAEANLTPIDPLPESDVNLLGITRMQEFTKYDSDEPMGKAGGVRYLAQVGNAVISVDVAGPLVDYNFDLAFWLLDAQVSCLEADAPCEQIPMPMGDGRWMLQENGLGYATEPGGNYEWARWQFPLESPVTEPEQSVTLP